MTCVFLLPKYRPLSSCLFHYAPPVSYQMPLPRLSQSVCMKRVICSGSWFAASDTHIVLPGSLYHLLFYDWSDERRIEICIILG